jgi:hypothetical protein
MAPTSRLILGFLVAPGVPACLLLLFNLFAGYGNASIVGPLLLMPLGYIAAIVVGGPVYQALKWRRIDSLHGYLVAGALTGPTFYVLFTILTSYPGTIMAVFQRSPGPMLMAFGYSITSAFLFWVIAIRKYR